MENASQNAALDGIIDCAMRIAQQRTATLQQMKDALLNGNTERALHFARQLVGIAPEPGRGPERAIGQKKDLDTGRAAVASVTTKRPNYGEIADVFLKATDKVHGAKRGGRTEGFKDGVSQALGWVLGQCSEPPQL